MLNKQTLITELLLDKLSEAKVGILAKGIGEIDPEAVAAELSRKRDSHIYVAAVGYGFLHEKEERNYTITPAIEKAVLWRSMESYDFTGKTIIPFATSGGSSMGKTNDKLQPSCPGAKLLEGKVFSSNAKIAELNTWVESLKL